MCEECDSCHDRTVRLVLVGQSVPLFVPSVMKTHIPLTDDLVNTIHPAPEIHEHFMIQKATEHCAQFHAQFQQRGAQCDQLREQHDAHRRDDRAALSTLHAVCR